MKSLRYSLGLFGLCAFVAARGAELDLGRFTLKMPDSYQEPQTASPAPHVLMHAFFVASAPIPKPSVLVLVRENDQGPRMLKPEESLAVSKKLAAEMVSATARRRTEFQASEPREIKLAGAPAVEVEWTGRLNDIQTSGRLFVMTVGSTAYFFHVMGGAPPARETLDAIEAVNNLKLKP
jgi:hypothetical protein